MKNTVKTALILLLYTAALHDRLWSGQAVAGGWQVGGQFSAALYMGELYDLYNGYKIIDISLSCLPVWTDFLAAGGRAVWNYRSTGDGNDIANGLSIYAAAEWYMTGTGDALLYPYAGAGAGVSLLTRNTNAVSGPGFYAEGGVHFPLSTETALKAGAVLIYNLYFGPVTRSALEFRAAIGLSFFTGRAES